MAKTQTMGKLAQIARAKAGEGLKYLKVAGNDTSASRGGCSELPPPRQDPPAEQAKFCK